MELDTIVSLATPNGESAIAVIRVSGVLSSAVLKGAFEVELNKIKPRRAVYKNYNSVSGNVLDEVVYVYYKGKASYTGEDSLEINCHGNTLISQKIIQDLIVRGCRMAEPGEYTKRAFLNEKLDLTQAEAVSDLIRAKNDYAIDVARKQLKGLLGQEIKALRSKLIKVLAVLEAYIDFPDEDLPDEETDGPKKSLVDIGAKVNVLLNSHRVRRKLLEGVKLLLLGSPNAGKSSLLNELIGENRAIVSAEPGTTRDYIKESMTINNYEVNVIDTAGLHETDSIIEQSGISKTFDQVAEADMFLLVVDSAVSPPELPKKIQAAINAKNCIIVENKIDLNHSESLACFNKGFHHARISIIDSKGINDLKASIGNLIESNINEHSGYSVVVNTRHVETLTEANKNIEDALLKFDTGEPSELIASDIKEAYLGLGNILGENNNEDMLDQLFSEFCIGK